MHKTEATRCRPSGAGVALATVAVVLGCWIVSVNQMQGMDRGPGTSLGSLPLFLGLWLTMMAAMMLPSALPMLLLFARVDRSRHSSGPYLPATAIFTAAYLLVWTGYGLAAFALYRAIDAASLGFLSWQRQGPLVAGATVIAVGLYELTPLKRACLRHCRSPMHFLLGGWRRGSRGALQMGIEHGGYCLGCCLGLMLLLFALGVMSLTWMAIVTGLVFAEKVLPRGDRYQPALATLLIGLGVWIAIAPATVPALTTPTSAG